MPALFRCVYGWCHEVWPSKKAPFVNNNLCWPRPTEKPFFSSLGLAVALYNCTQQTCGPEQKKRPNPSIACCINCPKKSFGENWGKRKHNQMQVEQRWSLQKLDQFYERHTGFLIWEIHPFRKAFLYFSAMQYYTVYENHKKCLTCDWWILWIWWILSIFVI